MPPSGRRGGAAHYNACAAVSGHRGRWTAALPGVLALLLGGCAAVGPPPAPDPDPDAPGGACRVFFADLDRAVTEAGVRDGIGAPAEAHPYLRGTRFLQAFHDALNAPDLRVAWLDAAQQTDRDARALELINLGGDALRGIELPPGADNPWQAVTDCGDTLRALDRLDTDAAAWHEARDALTVPDEYITWHRAAGVYPVSRWFIRAGVGAWQRGVRDTFENARPDDDPAYRYAPAEGAAVAQDQATALLAEAERDALGRPRLPARDWQRLFDAYAPVIEVEGEAPHNRIGAPGQDADGQPAVDTSHPVVYTSVSSTRFAGETHVQLSYTWWFTERPVDHWFDLLGGALDGLTLRLTLAPTGELLLAETMHNCGCYHQYYPVQGLLARARPDYAEPPLVLPGPGLPDAGERLHLRLEDGTHYVQSLAFAAPQPGSADGYTMRDYDRLRSLPRADGARRSLFQPDGLVPGTERRERWFFWVAGVPEPGAMRQSHRHATAFVGRRHFDDPDLLERIFKPAVAD